MNAYCLVLKIHIADANILLLTIDASKKCLFIIVIFSMFLQIVEGNVGVY
jgi:hypothetical protein